MVSNDVVLVLFQEVVCLVRDVPRIVVQRKGRSGKLRLGKSFVLREAVVELLGKIRTCRLWELALFVKQVNHSARLLLDEVEDVLVVHEIDVRPLDFLLLVLLLLLLEDLLVEVLLELLICEVDAELLKVVLLELLETVDVQNAHSELACGVLADGGVDLVHEPVEELGVDRFRERVPAVGRCCGTQGAGDRSIEGLPSPCGQCLLQQFSLRSQKLRCGLEALLRVLRQDTLLVILWVSLEDHVSKVQHDGHDPEHAVLVLLGHSNDRHGLLGSLVPLRVVHLFYL